MPYASLRDFMARLEQAGRLVRVKAPVSPVLEMTEIQTRLLAEGGPAVLVEDARVTLRTPGGVARLTGDASLDDGQLLRLDAAIAAMRSR